MREALAAADHDFVLTESASKLKRLRETFFASKRRGLSRLGRRGWHYLNFLAAGFFVATAAGILLNALVWQKIRHPAPLLFSRAVPASPSRGPKFAEVTMVPTPRRAHSAISSDEPREKPAENPPTPKPAVDKPAADMPAGGDPHRADASPARPRDQISELLNSGHTGATRSTPRAVTPPAASKAVLAAQRALVKLGFVLKVDGVAGAATRQAIQRYERERGLPMRGGELTPTLMRRLSAETGNSSE